MDTVKDTKFPEFQARGKKTHLVKIWKTVVWGFFDRLYALKLKRRLKNDSFSLITQNCIGGVLYHFLGKRFDSPTINLYIFQKDFCKFCSDLKYYLNCELRFYKKENNSIGCPYAYLGDGDKQISIQFTHYKSEQEALEKWNERKLRIHWDNLFIITNDGNGVSVDELNRLGKIGCKGALIFTSKYKPEINNSFQLRSLEKYDTAVYMQTERNKWTGLRAWQNEFDIVAWLNDSEKQNRSIDEYRI